MHPHWEEITGLFVDSGIDVAVLTNGTICDKHTIARLTALSKRSKFFSVQVSLDSYDPTVNDKTRGRGRDVVQSIFKMADAGLDIAVAMVIQSVNVDSALYTIEKLQCCVRRFNMMNLMPIPKAKASCRDLFVEGKRLSLFWDQVGIFRGENPDLYISTPDNVPNSSLGIGCFSCKGCVAGTTRATISPDLLVLPCGLSPNWVMGDLKRQTFEQAWNCEKARAVRDLETPPCMEGA